MTVKDLKDLIHNLPDEMEVILQKDAEGNGYSPLSEGYTGIYAADTTWYGDVFLETYTFEDVGFDTEEEWEAYKSKMGRSLILRPIN
jgi:hypothetical protein